MFPICPLLSLCVSTDGYIYVNGFSSRGGGVTEASTAGGSRPPSMSTTGPEMGISTVESAPKKGRGNQRGWEGA